MYILNNAVVILLMLFRKYSGIFQPEETRDIIVCEVAMMANSLKYRKAA